jgi:uncharacterized protein (DUF2147 family)
MRYLVLPCVMWIVFAAAASGAPAAAKKDPIAGLWKTEQGEAIVEMYGCGAEICGRFRWIRDDARGRGLRGMHRSLCRMQFIGGFKNHGGGHYDGGWIYDPDDGSTYDADMTLTDAGSLDLHGYLLLPFLGESRTWTRVSFSPSCRKDRP